MKCILLLAGDGNRFNHEIPKQFHFLSGKKVYLYALDACLQSNLFEEIILVCHPQWMEQVRQETVNVKIIPGGKTRQESSLLGIQASGNKTDAVFIHDAVRPFLSQEIIHAHFEKIRIEKAINTCIPAHDTINQVFDPPHVHAIPQRKHYYRGQTPQSFSWELIYKAHLLALEKNITNASDDCQLALLAGHPVCYVEGSEENIKITTDLDLFLAEQLLRRKKISLPAEKRSLEGKRFAITGGTGGIGSAISEALKKEKAYVHSISPTSKEYPCDLSAFEQCEQVFQQIEKLYGPLDGLINCTGQLIVKSFEHLSLEELESLVKINYKALLYACRCAKIKNGGHLINLSSSSFTRGRKDYAVYSSTKAAVVNFSQALAEERPDLHVNVIVPRRTRTPLRLRNFPDEESSTLLSPEEVAQNVVSLLKTEALTGSILEIK